MKAIALLLTFGLIGWIVLNHLRRDRFMRDYMRLLSESTKEGNGLFNQRLLALEEYMQKGSLRRSIMAFVLGITVLVIPLLRNLIRTEGVRNGALVGGILICAYGIGNLLIWLLIDRPRSERLREISRNNLDTQ
ncbi:MAG: hypothetical protein JSV33_02160 [bacterium]|nr:MAG: hypothetical protein JSV33_02160 [bacterium]